MKLVRLLLSKISLYLALAGIAAGVVLVNKLNQADPLPKPIAEPAINPFDAAIAASGIVESLDRNLLIGSPVSGLIKRVWVKAGDQVQKDAPLIEIDGRELEADLLVQQANHDVFQAQLTKLEDQFERMRSIQDLRAISGEELKTRQNDVLIATAHCRAAECLVKRTATLIERLTIKAPRAGVILQSNVREGEFLSSDAAIAALILGDLSQLQVRADIDEQNSSRFRQGQSAYAYPKNQPTLKIPLTFSHIEPLVIPKRSLTGSSEERVDTRVLQVIYTFDPPQNFPLYIGQQLDIYINSDAAL